LSVTVQHSDTRLALRARLQEMPDVSGMVAMALSTRKRTAAQVAALAARPAGASRPVEASARQELEKRVVADLAAKQAQRAQAEQQAAAAAKEVEAKSKAAVEAKAEAEGKAKAKAASVPADPQQLRARFDKRVEADELDAARRVGDRIVATVTDSVWLNDFAWAVLTEEAYGGRLDDVALVLARRSNELSGHANWYHLDTLALAEFRCGDVRRAVELQAEAVERAAGDPRQAEAVDRLQRYTAALREAKPIVRAGQAGPGG
jgi:hypothetical protein